MKILFKRLPEKLPKLYKCAKKTIGCLFKRLPDLAVK